ncbi:uncharacterized protein PgNI_03237 [Pyricularia grisea]|uniref:Uncharacterized protein n=1 Tax=Pyricularia grisea TaxID=148305 RepID=A0A6P8B8M0_PYRGI|nr:uncharacterized protein PgNI_03237 [Pyricularia grisea]TLD12173.1 hypothetical protein PgNI_03237 [Pyricularia grisea]
MPDAFDCSSLELMYVYCTVVPHSRRSVSRSTNQALLRAKPHDEVAQTPQISFLHHNSKTLAFTPGQPAMDVSRVPCQFKGPTSQSALRDMRGRYKVINYLDLEAAFSDMDVAPSHCSAQSSQSLVF